jgi:hypothetical protein
VAGAPPITRAPEIVPIGRRLRTLRNTTLDAHIGANFFSDFEEKASAYYLAYFRVPSDYHKAVAQHQNPQEVSYKPHAAVHEPRHDVESMFWLLCFTLARANPRSDAPNPHDPTAQYSEFCEVMLNRHQAPFLRCNPKL